MEEVRSEAAAADSAGTELAAGAALAAGGAFSAAGPAVWLAAGALAGGLLGFCADVLTGADGLTSLGWARLSLTPKSMSAGHLLHTWDQIGRKHREWHLQRLGDCTSIAQRTWNRGLRRLEICAGCDLPACALVHLRFKQVHELHVHLQLL